MAVKASSSASLWRFVLLFLFSVVLPCVAGCPRACACSASAEVHCTFKYLSAVPDSIQPAVKRLNLGYNSITVVRENDFSGLENLELLMLHSNSIHSLEDRAFHDLKSLQVLKMSYNKIKEIHKETFKSLDSVMRLHVDHNHIEFVNPEAFYGLTNLQLVSLEGNRLQQLHPDTFITLRHSQIFKVSSVKNLHLSDNLLSTLPEDIFSGCSLLENLFLHGNPWNCDCDMKWFSEWVQRNTGLLKCKRDRRFPNSQLCAVCQSPVPYQNRTLSLLHKDAFACSPPQIQSHLKQKNISLDGGSFTPVSSKDFVAPLGSLQMNLTDSFHNDASLTCTIQRPTAFETLTTQVEEEGTHATMLTANVTSYLVCNVDHEHIQKLWQILATYSDMPLRLGRGLMLSRSPEMIYKYSQIKTMDGEDGDSHIEADIKASPAWLMQGEVNFQLDRTMTTFSTLHIKYQSEVILRLESKSTKRESYSWTMIKRDNQTKSEHTVLTGGVAQLSCPVMGEPKPLLEWILPDGSKIRAPYSSEDRRIIITADGRLTVRGVDASDTGLYRCIATNYLDADILIFRVTVLSPDVEEETLNGVQLSKPDGGSLVFDCTSSGSPRPSVSWILPDHSILEKSHGNRKLYENGTLHIQGLTARDQGFYTCLVANQLGVDLLVSQVKVEETLETETTINSHTSGLIMEVNHADNLDEITSSSVADRTSQESRTITSDRPYPRRRPKSRGNPGDILGQRRRGGVRNRHVWSNRVFEKTSRQVDPQRFADFVKKAEALSRKKTEKEDKEIGFSGDNENGSGEVYLNQYVDLENVSKEINYDGTTESYMQSDSTSLTSGFTLIPRITESPITERVSSPSANINPFTLQFSVMDTSQETQIQFSGEPSVEHEHSAGAMLSAPTDSNVTPMKTEKGPVEMVIHTDHDSQTLLTAFTTTERTEDAITFHTTQTIKAPRLPPGSTIISQQQIHVIPRKNSRGRGRGRKTFPGRRRIIKPNRITDIQSFINKLKQPTITMEGNVSVPYRIKLTTDGDGHEGYKKTEDLQMVTPTTSSSQIASTQKTTVSFAKFFITSTPPFSESESRSYISSQHVTSAADPEFSTIIGSFLTTKKEPLIPNTNSISTSTTASTALNRRIPLNRRFGGRERNRLNVPLTTHQPRLTDGTTAFTRTTTHSPISTITPSSLAQPVTFITHRPMQSKESTIYNDYGKSTSADFTTLRPIFSKTTTTSSTRTTVSSTISYKNPDVRTLPATPTVIPQSKENSDEYLSSGSGGMLDSLYVVTQRPWSRKGNQAQRKNFGGRRPYKKPGIKNIIPTIKPLDSAVLLTMKGTTMKPTTELQQAVSLYNNLNPQRKEDTITLAISIDPPLLTELDMEEEWASGVNPIYPTDKTPRITSVTHKPTLERSYSTAHTLVPRTFRLPKKSAYDNKANSGIERNISPLVQSPEASTREPFSAAQLTTLADIKDNNIYSLSPYMKNIDKAIVTEDNTENKVTSDITTVFEATTKVMRNKPKIVGGNAASFTVLSDSDAFMPCEASGNPQPVITWKRFISNTGNTITIKGKMGKIEISINGTLSIRNANIKDRGQYLCVAENDYGSDKLLVTLTVVAYPPHILEPKIREIKSHSGQTVEMKCNAEGRPMPMISWILANQTQVRGVNSQKGRVSVSGVGTLIIKSVTVYDRGQYKCIASNPAGADTATVRLQVVAAPPGIVEEKRQHLKAQSNQPLWLPCTGHGTPNPSVHWVLNDGSVLRANRPSSYTKIFMYGNGTLFFKDVTPAESGKYECIATSSTGSERRVVTLVVEKQELAPKILKKSPRKTNLFFGDQLQLDCSATGEPKPTIIWRLPSKAVVDHWHRTSNRIQVLENGTLIVNSMIDKDAGDYLCVVRNNIGDDLHLVRVSVSMTPAKIEPKLSRKKQIPYGKEFKVDCKASGAPKPDISWGLPDGTMVNSALQSDASVGGKEAQRYTLFENGTLYLNQVGMSEEGDYTCYAQNPMGKDEMQVHISVMTAAPRIRPPNQVYMRVKPGENIRFDCEALGEPKPKILWLLPTNDIIAASNERYLMHVNGSLDIRDVNSFDAGEYVCLARNPGGETRNVYKLEIDGNPPIINGYRQNRTVMKDFAPKHSRKLIDCKAEGDPTPTITWIMPDNILLTAPYFGSRINVHYNGTLEIHNVRPTDTAEFICMARNDGGEAVMVVQLQVTDPFQRPIFKNPFNERVMSRHGKPAVLNCSAQGNPLPEIIWTFPNRTKFTGGQIVGTHYNQLNDGSLVIYHPQKEDAGKYRCGAKNLMGYIEKLIILDIGQKPYILTRPRGIIRSTSGEPLFLHCLADGTPSPRIYWTLPGGHTLTRPQVNGRYKLLENGTLVISAATLHDRGNYICRARNNVGEAGITVPVIIIGYPPRITTGPLPSVRVVTGTPIQLNCAATGIPKPEIFWELHGHRLLSEAEQGHLMGIELDHNEGTLILKRPTTSDSGPYKCVAKNHLGIDSRITYVLIQ